MQWQADWFMLRLSQWQGLHEVFRLRLVKDEILIAITQGCHLSLAVQAYTRGVASDEQTGLRLVCMDQFKLDSLIETGVAGKHLLDCRNQLEQANFPYPLVVDFLTQAGVTAWPDRGQANLPMFCALSYHQDGTAAYQLLNGQGLIGLDGYVVLQQGCSMPWEWQDDFLLAFRPAQAE
jgi:hypothetical protein